ncbi:stalk domain-containing protein [Cohnella sp.]|uniref:stalk domain-containing protein n=1 Tax=Cohnella sp. TaxID=1883426 RepID=UPI0035630C76
MYNLQWRQLYLIMMLMAFFLVFTVQPAAAASAGVKVKSEAVGLEFDGKTLVIPQGQYIFVIKGSTYVPLRFFSYALQKNVAWDSKTNTVSVTNPTKQQAVMLQEYLLNATGQAGEESSKGGTSIAVKPIQAKFMFDGDSKALPQGQSGYSLNGSIYVPIRFMSQSVGTQINWDKTTGRITGESTAYKAEKAKENTEDVKEEGTVPVTDTKQEAGTGTGGVGGAGGGGAGGVTTYESITANAESTLYALKASCENQLMPLGLQLIIATDSNAKQQLINQMNGIIDQCTVQFNQAVADVEIKLTAGGYSTSIIADYRKAFQDEMDAGRALLEGLNS